MSGTKVKGLLKGLRYISQIFEEKEDEIEIGFPTDVKHVAHIGSDDPSANAPSWMNEYKSANPSGAAVEDTETPEERKSKPSIPKEKPSKVRHLIPKSRHQSIDTESNPTSKKTTRRHHRSSDPSADSSTHDSSSGGSRHRRHHRRGSNHGSDSASADIPPTDTKTHRRKSKNSEDGSVRKPSSRRSSKGDSLTDISITDFGSGSIPETGNEPK
ncbi:WD40 repeat protein [Trifolium repens]|nr:CRIB domain-containing protein RIC7 [Trifolium repens]WJX17155.1 WD40 repeat protein [Trifolium repens]